MKKIPENHSFKNTLFLIVENEPNDFTSNYGSAAKKEYEQSKEEVMKLPLELIFKTRINLDNPGNYSLYKVKVIS